MCSVHMNFQELDEKGPPRIPYTFEKNTQMVIYYQEDITVLSHDED